MMQWINEFPAWVSHTVWTAVILGVSYGLGHFLKWAVCRRLVALAARTKSKWDDVFVAALTKRVPLWCLLLGGYYATSLWALAPTVEAKITKTLFVLAVSSVTFFAAAIVTKLSVLYGEAVEQALPITSLTQNIVTGVIVTIGLLVILNGLGLSITPMLTALGVGGLAVALALQDTLANLFAGVYITIAGQIRVGDYVLLDSGPQGYVADIGWRSTRIRMLPNNIVLVPNSKLSQAIVTNYHLPEREMSFLMEVGVDYDSDLAGVERVTCEVAKEVLQAVPGGVPTFDPFIRYHTFGDSSINFTVILRAQEYVDQYLLKHEFIKRLYTRYKQEGINIPFPIRTLIHKNLPPAGRTGE